MTSTAMIMTSAVAPDPSKDCITRPPLLCGLRSTASHGSIFLEVSNVYTRTVPVAVMAITKYAFFDLLLNQAPLVGTNVFRTGFCGRLLRRRCRWQHCLAPCCS